MSARDPHAPDRDKVLGDGRLAFDLREILAALGPDALAWSWAVPGLEDGGEALEAVGEGLAELEALSRSGGRVSGFRLAEIAGRIGQVVWGEFRAYRDPRSTEPLLRIVAFDNSFFEVHTADRAVIERVRLLFGGTASEPPAVP